MSQDYKIIAHLLRRPMPVRKWVYPDCALITDPETPDVFHMNYRLTRDYGFLLLISICEAVNPELQAKFVNPVDHAHYDTCSTYEEALAAIEEDYGLPAAEWVRTEYVWHSVVFGDSDDGGATGSG